MFVGSSWFQMPISSPSNQQCYHLLWSRLDGVWLPTTVAVQSCAQQKLEIKFDTPVVDAFIHRWMPGSQFHQQLSSCSRFHLTRIKHFYYSPSFLAAWCKVRWFRVVSKWGSNIPNKHGTICVKFDRTFNPPRPILKTSFLSNNIWRFHSNEIQWIHIYIYIYIYIHSCSAVNTYIMLYIMLYIMFVH